MPDAKPTLALEKVRRPDNTCNAVALLMACSTSKMFQYRLTFRKTYIATCIAKRA